MQTNTIHMNDLKIMRLKRNLSELTTSSKVKATQYKALETIIKGQQDTINELTKQNDKIYNDFVGLDDEIDKLSSELNILLTKNQEVT